MNCPRCGCAVSEDHTIGEQLSDLGYSHRDEQYICPECGDTFQRGIPLGEPADDTWICDSCDGDLMPHFVYVFEDEARIKPKCRDCYWVPDDPITLDVSDNGTSRRLFVGHHSVTGDRSEATSNTY